MSAISVDITSLEARVWLAENMDAGELLGLIEQVCTIRMNKHLALDGQGMPTCSASEAYRSSCFEAVANIAKSQRRALKTLVDAEAILHDAGAEEKTPRGEAPSGGTRDEGGAA